MPYFAFPTPLGPMTAFEEDGRLVALEWGSPPPGAESTALLTVVKEQLDAYFDKKLRQFDLPFAAEGSIFQKRVWAAMSDIPYGQTLTYADIAEKIGSAPRAIGGACGRNPLPIVVPCHRVLSRNGIGGYSGADGIPTKRFLLALESVDGPALFHVKQG